MFELTPICVRERELGDAEGRHMFCDEVEVEEVHGLWGCDVI